MALRKSTIEVIAIVATPNALVIANSLDHKIYLHFWVKESNEIAILSSKLSIFSQANLPNVLPIPNPIAMNPPTTTPFIPDNPTKED